MNIDKQRMLAVYTINLDNHLYDVIKSYISWLPMFGITVPEFMAYYEKHGIYNIRQVLKD